VVAFGPRLGRARGRLMGAAILSVATAVPEHRVEAADALRHLREFFPQLDRLDGADASLGTRHLCEPLEQVLRPRGLTDLRRSYLRHASRLAQAAAARALEAAGVSGDEIDLVITVSCTGYVVPSLDVHLAEKLGLRPDVIRLPITELGCSGGAAAIAAARRHLAGFPDDRVLVVAVEVPSLSFHPGDQSVDNLTASLVFGDGAGAAVLARPDSGRSRLEVVRTASHLIPGTAGILGFDLRDSGFHVVLDRRLPRVLASEVRPVVDRFIGDGEVPAPAFYAVHAAGPRIFSVLESALVLHSGALDVSRGVFARVGNTSSAAIFFALEDVIASRGPDAVHGLGIGVGPGVTLELMHLEWVPVPMRRLSRSSATGAPASGQS
jgi:predicted naringenin-chalcone synthase